MTEHKENSFLKYIFFAFIVLCLARFIFTGRLVEISAAFKPFIIACVMVYLFAPAVSFVHKNIHCSRAISVIVTYLFFLLILAFSISMIVPSIVESITLLIETITSYNEEEFITFLQRIPYLSNFIDTSTLSDFLSNLEILVVEYSSNLLNYSKVVFSSIGSFLVSVVIFLFAMIMSFYALKDTADISGRLENVISAFFSSKVASQIIRISRLTDQSVKKYLIGKSYACIILALILGISMTIVNMVSPLKIPFIPLIALIVGLLNIIPFIGGMLGTIPSVIIALFTGFWEAIAVLIIITIAQQIDNLIVSPKLIGDSVGLKPFWVIVSITIGGSLFGPIGMILSAPFVSVILFLVDEKVSNYNQAQAFKKKRLLEEAAAGKADKETSD